MRHPRRADDGKVKAMNPPPTAKAIHEYDQAHTRRNKELDKLIYATVEAMRGYRREIAVAGVALYLHDELSHKACAELLSCALERIAVPA
jgi:hypothetical protein